MLSQTLHLHIGVDRVLEDAVAALWAESGQLAGRACIDAATYQGRLRAPVDQGAPHVLAQAAQSVWPSEGEVFLSRPKLLYRGRPLNLAGAAAFYKMDVLRQAFPEARIVVHLLLTDHLSYLCRSAPRDLSAADIQGCSWRPLVKGLRTRLGPGDVLRVWNSEDEMFFLQEAAEAFLDLSVSEALAYAQAAGRRHPPSDPQALEAAGLARNWDPAALDLAYERDLDWLASGRILQA